MADYQRNFGAPAAQLRGEFFVDTEKDGLASAQAGRDIFRSIDRVRIVIPGAVASIVVKNVDDTHRERWPEAYAAFKRGQEAPLQGMPLEEWPILNKAMIAELHHLQIRTVEELAGLSDIAVQHVGMGGQMLRERARAWFDDAQNEALTNKLLGENDALRSRVATLETQVEALGQQMLQMASAAQHQRDMVPAAHAYVPGQHDPHEIAKAAGAALMPPVPGSSLDALAQSGGGRRRRRPEPTEEEAA
jgi:hypothetical protein